MNKVGFIFRKLYEGVVWVILIIFPYNTGGPEKTIDQVGQYQEDQKYPGDDLVTGVDAEQFIEPGDTGLSGSIAAEGLARG